MLTNSWKRFLTMVRWTSFQIDGQSRSGRRSSRKASRRRGATLETLERRALLSGSVPPVDLDPAPHVAEIRRTAGEMLSASEAEFVVRFSEHVNGVDPGDFQILRTGALGVTGETIVSTSDGLEHHVRVKGIQGTGTLALRVHAGATIHDDAGNPLVNPGIASFGPAESLGSGTRLASGDVNGDGRLDLVIASETEPGRPDGGVRLQLGLADGTWESWDLAVTAGQIPLKPTNVALGDVDGDGDLDLVVASPSQERLALFTWEVGSGDGGFEFQSSRRIVPESVDSGTAPARAEVRIADVNNDGRPEIVVAFGLDPVLWSHDPAAGGSVTPLWGVEVTGALGAVNDFVIADLDADGDNDLAAAHGSGHVTLWRGGASGLSLAQTLTFSGGALAIAAGDLTGDGLLDLAVSLEWVGIQPLLQGGDHSFTAGDVLSTGDFHAGLELADIDRDGRLDAVWTNTEVKLPADVSLVGVRRNNAIYFAPGADGVPHREIIYGDGIHEEEYLVGDFGGLGRSGLAVRRDHNLLTFDTDLDGVENFRFTYGDGNHEDGYYTGIFGSNGRAGIAVRRGTEFIIDSDLDGRENFRYRFSEKAGADQYLVGNFGGQGRAGVAARYGNQFFFDVDLDGLVDFEFRYGDGPATSQYLAADFGGPGLGGLAARYGDMLVIDSDLDGLENFRIWHGNGTTEHEYLVGRFFDPTAYLTESGNSLGVGFGTGDGAFANGAEVLSGSRPQAVHVAHFDNDRLPDLLFSGTESNSAGALRNTADGEFTGPVYTVTGVYKAGGEFQVNTEWRSDQTDSAVAMDDAGNFVVTWMSLSQTGNGWDIKAQRFNANGAPLSSELLVDTANTPTNQFYPSVASDGAGNFVVAWQNSSESGSGYDIWARRFNASGAAVTGEFRVNSAPANDQTDPVVAMSRTGSFVIVWASQNSDASWDIWAQRYYASGAIASDASGAIVARDVTSSLAGSHIQPAVAIDDAGNFIVAWTTFATGDGLGSKMQAQRYNASGLPIGPVFLVHDNSGDYDQTIPSVAMNGAGAFVITWASLHQDGSGWGVYGKKYTASGIPLTGEFRVSTTTDSDQHLPAVAMDRSENFVVTWSSKDQDGSGWGVYARRYGSDGNPLGSEFRVNTRTSGDQYSPAIAMNAAGTFVIPWMSQNQDGGGWGIYAQRFRVAPVITNLSVTPIASEHGVVTLTGTYTHDGTQQSHGLTVNWRDGVVETVNVSGGSFTRTHRYLDDLPSGTGSDPYGIEVTLTDSESGSHTRSTSTRITNLAPAITKVSVSTSMINQERTVTLTGSFTDAGSLDTHTVEVFWGDGRSSFAAVNPVSRAFIATHQYVDAPSGTPADVYTIQVTVRDDDGGTASTGAVSVTALLGPTAVYSTSGGAYNLAVADLNGDGHSDIIAPSLISGVTVLWNSGNGTFTTSWYATGSQHYNAAAADFNGDGRLDIALTNRNDVQVLLNNGSGGFGSAVITSAPAYSLAAGDLNGDGRQDLVVGHGSSGGGIRFLAGSGNGAFAPAVGLGSNFTVHDVALADVNGDGRLDALGATMTSDGVVVHLNTGNSANPLGTGLHYLSGGYGSRHLAVGDLTGDGRSEIVIANHDTNSVSVLRNNGAGAFTLLTTVSSGGNRPYSVGISDFDADGRKDVVTINVSGQNGDPGNVAVLLGNGAGGLSIPAAVRLFPSGGAWTHDAVIGDFNGDGAPDVAVGNSDSGTVGVLLNTSNTPPVAVNDVFSVNEDGVLTVPGAAGNPPTAILGAGIAVSTPDRIATFGAVVSGTPLQSYTENGLRITVDSLAFGNGVHSVGGAYGATSIRTVDASDMYGLECSISNTWAAVSNFIHWWMYDDGVLVGQGVFSSAKNSVSGFSYAGGFDELKIGAYSTLSDAQSATPSSRHALQIDNVKVELTMSGVLGNDSDANGNSLTAALATGPAHGDLTLNGDGSFSYTPRANYNGTDTFTYRSFDGRAYSSLATVIINVVAVNDVPRANAGADQVAEEGSTVSFMGSGVDEDGDPLTFVWDLDDGTTAEGASVPHVYVNDGVYTAKLTVTDGKGESHTDTVLVTVTNADPTLTITGASSSSLEGTEIHLALSVTDNGIADTVTSIWTVTKNGSAYTSGGLASVGETLLSFTPDDDGTYVISLTATDDDGGVAQTSETITVTNVAPAITSLSVDSAVVNENGSVTLTGSFTDPGTQDAHTLTIAWGDGTSETVSLVSGARTFSVTHRYLDDNPTESSFDANTITGTLSDDDGGTVPLVTVPTTISTVNQTNLAAKWQIQHYSPIGQTFTAESDQALSIGLFIDDMNAHVAPSDFSIDFDLYAGVGTAGPLLGTRTFSSLSNDFNGFADVDFSSVALIPGATYTVIVRNDNARWALVSSLINKYDGGVLIQNGTSIAAQDAGFRISWPGMPSVSPQVTVSNVAPVITNVSVSSSIINEDGSVTLTGSFADVGTLDTHTVEIFWDDGTSSLATVDATNRTFSATHQYLDNHPVGTDSDGYTITVRVSDDDGGVGQFQTAVSVRNVAPEIQNVTLTPEEINENGTVQLSFRVFDVGTLDKREVTIDWGDGSLSGYPLGLAPSFISTQHRYEDDNADDSYTITITARDDDGGETILTRSVQVHNVGPTAGLFLSHPNTPTQAFGSPDENGTILLSGLVSDPGTRDTFTLSLDWGDPLSPDNVQTIQLSHWSISSGGVTWDPTTRRYSVLHQYRDDNPTGSSQDLYQLNITIIDDDGEGEQLRTGISVRNVAPEIRNVSLTPAEVDENGTVQLSFDVFDVGTLDQHEVTIDWGDGSLTSYPFGVAPASISTQHRYADDNAADSYTITITARDDDGGFGTSTRTVAVKNVSPLVSISGAPSTSPEGTEISLGSSVSDPGESDTFTYAWTVTKNGSSYASGSASSLTFTPNDNGTYIVSLMVSDDDGGVGNASRTIAVTNEKPVVSIVGAPATTPEGTAITLGSSSSDAGTADTLAHFWNVRKNGSFYTSGSGAGISFTPNDNGTYLVILTATDDDGGSTSSSETISVTNVEPIPSITNVPASSPEGTAITLGSSVSDVGAADTFTYAWTMTKDGTFYAGGTKSSLTFTPDDNGTYLASLSVRDDDGGGGTVSRTIAVTNVNPVASIINAPTSSPEGTSITVGSTVGDAGTADTFTSAWTVTRNGSLYTSGNGSDLSFRPNDNGTYAVTLAVTDDDGGQTSTTRTVQVLNVAPRVTAIQGPSSGLAGADLTFTISASDASAVDQANLTYVINWGDWSTQTIDGPGELSVTHRFHSSGSYLIGVTVFDKEGQKSAEIKRSVSITPVMWTSGQLSVSMSGSPPDGSMTIGNGSVIVSFFDENNALVEEFHFTDPVDNIVVYGSDEDDDIRVASTILLPVEVFGGDGNDRIQGGGGQNTLHGGAGADTLIGGLGSNSLDGGEGDDTVHDGGGTNTIIAGAGSNTFVSGGGTNTFQADAASATEAADAPQLIVSAAATGGEGSPLSIPVWASLSDLGGSERLALTITGVPVGSVLSHGQRNSDGSWTLESNDGVVDLSDLTLTATDNGTFTLHVIATATELSGGTTHVVTAEIQVTVANVAPVATSNRYQLPQASSVSGNVILDDTDIAGANDPLTASVVSGPANGKLVLNPDGSFTYTPETTFVGQDRFTYRIADGDDGFSSADVVLTVKPALAGTVTVVADTLLGGTALLVAGTSENDLIVVTPGSTGTTLQVTVNGVRTTVAKPTGRVIVFGREGDDNIQIAGAVLNPVWLYGDGGNDRMNAGNGGGLLFGGDDNDELLGGNGRDILIGGDGADRLIGNGSDDILIGGSTKKDVRGGVAHEAFWRDVVHAWSSTDSASLRVGNLRGSLLLTGNLVDDCFVDSLTGAAGDDWLLFDSRDKVSGPAEFSN